MGSLLVQCGQVAIRLCEGAPAMTIEEAMAVLGRGNLEPVYVLAGPNRYWAGAWLKRARERFLGADDETNLVRLDGVQDFTAVRLELASGGFFGSRKMVVVEHGRWPKKEEQLARYIEDPAPDAMLVLVEEKLTPSLDKALGRHRVVELKDLTPMSFQRFVQEEADRRNIRFQTGGLERFCQLVAGNEYQVQQELEKMALWSLEAWRPGDVEEQVAPIPGDEPLWDVTDALLRRDAAKTQALVMHHLSRGVAPLLLFIMMARQIIQVDRAQRAQTAGLSLGLFQKQEGLRDFVAKKVWSAAHQWPAEDVAELMEWAGRIDVAMKTGYGEPEVWLALWGGLWTGKKNPPGQRGGRKDRT